MAGMMRRQARRRTIVGAAATASMVSSARTNRAQRKALENYNDQQSVANETQSQGNQSDLTSQLEELKRLKDQGILTEEEFQAKKKQLLGI